MSQANKNVKENQKCEMYVYDIYLSIECNEDNIFWVDAYVLLRACLWKVKWKKTAVTGITCDIWPAVEQLRIPNVNDLSLPIIV